MGFFDILKRKSGNDNPRSEGSTYEFCPRCEANLTLQKGYDNNLPYWICRGCGETLINPEIPDSEITWICDRCGAMLNIQDGFFADCGSWNCTACGYANRIDKSEIYLSEDEFVAELNSPYRGLTDDQMLSLSMYREEDSFNNRDDILLVRDMENDQLYVKKLLGIYDRSVYEYLKEHPIEHMPKIRELFESDNCLIVIEEYIEGKTILEALAEGPFDTQRAIAIAKSLCCILTQLHGIDPPVIHRDVKPSNVIISPDGEVYLLDINAAKWYREGEAEDTVLLGTKYYAAPEQFGYGFTSSSEKTDIYALGMLLNVMITGKLPKEEKAPGPVFDIVERCISLKPEERPTDAELMEALHKYDKL